MSQNLTQPEEIDLVLMAMADLDMELDTPNTDRQRLTVTSIHQGELHEHARAARHSQVAQH